MDTEQLIFNLYSPSTATFENFFAGKNQEAIDFLNQTFVHRRESYVYLWGRSGVGKTHLVHATCQWMQQKGFRSFYLDFVQLEKLSPKILDDLETFDLVGFDNIQWVCGHAKWQEALFYFYNRFREQGNRLLITADQSPLQLPIELADLKSRLSWGLVLYLHEGNDEDKIHMLQIRAKEIGMSLSDEVCHYIFNHYSREMHQLMQLLEKLDKHSLIEQRKITIPFLKMLIKNKQD